MARTVTSSLRFGGANGREAAPMGEINTTPLIDVMLVLLVMIIITVPPQTHKVGVDLPQIPIDTIDIRPLSNDLRMAANGTLRWNEQAISDGQLAVLLADVAARPKPPEVHFRPDAAARYERVDEVLAIAARSEAKTFGFAGNEQYRDSF